MLNQRDALILAHRANIERYRKILKTRLTLQERAYVGRRIAEEKVELERLSDGTVA